MVGLANLKDGHTVLESLDGSNAQFASGVLGFLDTPVVEREKSKGKSVLQIFCRGPYFNEAASGPQHGAAHLVDGNIDWGQDLLYLKDWLEQHPECRPLHLAYFGLVDPRLVGIDFSLPAPGPVAAVPDERADRDRLGPQPGYYAVSVNFVHGLEFSAPDGQGGLHYNSLHTFDYFHAFTPVARGGYSILIYHISCRGGWCWRRPSARKLVSRTQEICPNAQSAFTRSFSKKGLVQSHERQGSSLFRDIFHKLPSGQGLRNCGSKRLLP